MQLAMDSEESWLTTLDLVPERLLAGTDLEAAWQAHCPSTDVPEENAKRVDVDAVVVAAAEQLGRHVDRRPDHAAGHHRLRLAETKVRQLAPVVVIQLNADSNANQCNLASIAM